MQALAVGAFFLMCLSQAETKKEKQILKSIDILNWVSFYLSIHLQYIIWSYPIHQHNLQAESLLSYLGVSCTALNPALAALSSLLLEDPCEEVNCVLYLFQIRSSPLLLPSIADHGMGLTFLMPSLTLHAIIIFEHLLEVQLDVLHYSTSDPEGHSDLLQGFHQLVGLYLSYIVVLDVHKFLISIDVVL